MTQYDPFTLTEAGIVRMLTTNPRLWELVSIGNRVHFHGADRDPLVKPMTLNADRPELVIEPLGTEPDVSNTSADWSCWRRFRVYINTGDMRTNWETGDDGAAPTGINAVEWEIHRTMVRLDGRGRDFGCPWVINVRCEACNLARFPQDDESRQRPGWSGVCDIRAHCKFSHSEWIKV